MGKPSPTFRPKILATPSEQFELVRGKSREISGGYAIGPGVGGVAAICPTTQIPGFVAYTVEAPVSITGDYSLLVYASASGNSSGLETHTIDHGGALALTAFQFSNTSIVGFLDGNTTGSISGVFTQPTVAIAVRRGNTAWLYVGNQSSSSVTGTRAGEPTGLVIGRDRVSNDPAGGVKTYLYALFDYGLSATEIASLIKNPWRVIEPEQSYVPFASGGGAAALAGGATFGATATGALSTAIPILGAAVSGATASGSLSTAISLAGATATISATATGALSATIRLAGDALAGALAAGGLATGIPLAGGGSVGGAGTGDLSTGSGLAGAGAAGAAGTGILTTQITLSGAAVAQAIASGALTTTPTGLAGDGTSSSSGSGALSTGIPLAGAAAVSVVGAGGLVTAIPLAGAATVAVSATGDLVVSLGLAGAALISAIGSGALLTSITLNGAAVTGAVGAGALSGAALHASPWRTVTSLARVRSVRATARVRRCIAGVR